MRNNSNKMCPQLLQVCNWLKDSCRVWDVCLWLVHTIQNYCEVLRCIPMSFVPMEVVFSPFIPVKRTKIVMVNKKTLLQMNTLLDSLCLCKVNFGGLDNCINWSLHCHIDIDVNVILALFWRNLFTVLQFIFSVVAYFTYITSSMCLSKSSCIVFLLSLFVVASSCFLYFVQWSHFVNRFSWQVKMILWSSLSFKNYIAYCFELGRWGISKYR